MNLLMWLFTTPFLASLVIFCLRGISTDKLKKLSFAMSLIPLCMLLSEGSNLLGSTINYKWASTLSIQFHLTVDSLSLLFLYLTSVIIPISILSEKSRSIHSANFFYSLILLLQGLLIGFFTTRDLAFFTFFWESMLLPVYFLMNMWGGNEGQKASFKFIIYMIAGSTLMVIAVLALYFAASSTFNLDALTSVAQTLPYAALICAIFLLAFAVKTPLFPFHSWLPDAYSRAPTTATILLAALLSKAGVYGFLRIGVGLFPQYMADWSPLLLTLAIIGVLYGALGAWGQTDFKRLISYSSLSHINFVLAGLFILNEFGRMGAVLQAINHAITITGLFLVSGWLENLLGTTDMKGVSGLAKYLPRLCWITLFFVLSSVALPGLNNFVGEILILYGLFAENVWLTALLALSVLFSVIYMLRFMQNIYFETPSPFQKNFIDIGAREIALALPLIALIVWLGIYPAPVLKQIETTSILETHP